MKRFLLLGVVSAVIASSVVAVYLYSIYEFVPKGSPSPLVEPESLMRKELTISKVVGLYVLLSLSASLILYFFNRSKWGILFFNALIVGLSLMGFYYVLTFQKEGWDSFQIIGTPLFFILPLVWLALQAFFLTSPGNARH